MIENEIENNKKFHPTILFWELQETVPKGLADGFSIIFLSIQLSFCKFSPTILCHVFSPILIYRIRFPLAPVKIITFYLLYTDSKLSSCTFNNFSTIKSFQRIQQILFQDIA